MQHFCELERKFLPRRNSHHNLAFMRSKGPSQIAIATLCLLFGWRISDAQTQTPTTITPISLTLANTASAYTQNFDTLASTGTSNNLPSGWGFVENLSDGLYTAGSGRSTTGDTYSYGSTSSSDRAFGSLSSGTLNPTVGAVFTNNSGITVSAITISYTGEEWRMGDTGRGTQDQLDFQYKISSTLTGSGWTDDNSLDFKSPDIAGTAGSRNGNSVADRSALTHTITGANIAQWPKLGDPLG
jgi:hypothetical protein